ncbi:MAG: cupin domain-containing protein [Ferruginibacter sp.]|nr:cupin domain-containing protein [Chitinophagaceae bacterium]
MKCILITGAVVVYFFTGCKDSTKAIQPETIGSPKAWPDTSYWNKPEAKFDSSDYVIQLKHMQPFYDVPGEFGHIADGKVYGFTDLSFILTNTQPNGGPPLHTHTTEEAHVLHEGSVSYIVGDKKFAAKGPYIFRIPPGVPHTFINTGDKPFNLVAVFPGNTLTYTELGRNPLVKDTTVYHRHPH